MNELVDTFIQYIPRVLGSAVILIVGLVLAVVARRGTTFLLRRFDFDEICERIGVTNLISDGEARRSPTRFTATVVFYAVFLFAILAALGPLGLDFLAAALNQVVLYAPRALAAILVLVLGTSAAGVISEMAARMLSGLGASRTGGVKTFVRFSVIFIVAILAAAILEIDVTILIVVTILGFGAVALTASLALGLGLRGLSQNIAAGRYLSEGLQEGDEITLNNVSGTIEHIGHAMTTVRNPDGRVYLVPNGHFLENVVEKREFAAGEDG